MARKKDEQAQEVTRQRIKPEDGALSPSEGRLWRKAQVPYKNYAGFDDAFDAKATSFVLTRREQFRTRMAGPMRRWGVNWSAANTEVFWNEHEDDVHMPETKKALDSKVARVEEAITQFDPVFECEGVRGELNRRTAKTMSSYIYRQMEMAQWRNFVQPCARDAELCNIAALKVTWDEREEYQIERHDKVEYDDKTGQPIYTPIRKMRKAVTFRGPRLHQVDPFWFIYDLEANTPEECAYIGDESTPFLHDLEAMAEQGVYSKKQVKKVKEATTDQAGNYASDNTSRAEWPDQLRRFRSIAMGPEFSRDIRGEHGAVRVRVLEMWAWFDFGDGFDGIVDPLGKRLTGMQRMVITVANGIPIRVQQNPFDRKFVPYAFTQINRTGHELVAPAPFDSVVQMNAHYDRLSSNIMRWMDLAVSPVIVTQDMNTDLPDSIMEVEPGAVLRNTGPWNFIKVPDVTGSVGYFHGFFRNELEELSGALRIHESPQGTATETERKVQEQQRMVRNSIRAGGELWRQVAMLFKNLDEQFALGPERFRVVGKASTLLGRHATVTPQMLKEDVDFRFLGLADLHTFGNRAQGMAQYMNMWGPMLAQLPELNMPRLARLHFELLVGQTASSQIFPDDTAAWESWSQDEENSILMAGMEVDINERDNHMEHMEKAVMLFNSMSEKKAPQYILTNILAHIQAHQEAAQRQDAQRQQELEESQHRAMLQAPQGGEPGVDRPAAAGGMAPPPKSETPGVTPGPEQARTVSRTGRDGAGMSQTQEMR